MIHEDVDSFIAWHHPLLVFTLTFHLSYNLFTYTLEVQSSFSSKEETKSAKYSHLTQVGFFSVHNSQGMANRWVTMLRATHSLSSTAVCFANTENQTNVPVEDLHQSVPFPSQPDMLSIYCTLASGIIFFCDKALVKQKVKCCFYKHPYR